MVDEPGTAVGMQTIDGMQQARGRGIGRDGLAGLSKGFGEIGGHRAGLKRCEDRLRMGAAASMAAVCKKALPAALAAR